MLGALVQINLRQNFLSVENVETSAVISNLGLEIDLRVVGGGRPARTTGSGYQTSDPLLFLREARGWESGCWQIADPSFRRASCRTEGKIVPR